MMNDPIIQQTLLAKQTLLAADLREQLEDAAEQNSVMAGDMRAYQAARDEAVVRADLAEARLRDFALDRNGGGSDDGGSDGGEDGSGGGSAGSGRHGSSGSGGRTSGVGGNSGGDRQGGTPHRRVAQLSEELVAQRQAFNAQTIDLEKQADVLRRCERDLRSAQMGEAAGSTRVSALESTVDGLQADIERFSRRDGEANVFKLETAARLEEIEVALRSKGIRLDLLLRRPHE